MAKDNTKKIVEMTDAELDALVNVLNSIDSKETAGLAVEAYAEINRRKEAAEAKKRAEKEAAEKERQEKLRKQQKAANALVEKQKRVLGKYFKKVDDHEKTLYQVNGVEGEYALVTKLYVYEYKIKKVENLCNTIILIDNLLKLTEITDVEFESERGTTEVDFDKNRKTNEDLLKCYTPSNFKKFDWNKFFDDFFDKFLF